MQEQICWVVAGADKPPPRSDPAADGLDCGCSKAGLANGVCCWENAGLLETP
jgi:hypothetical protein